MRQALLAVSFGTSVEEARALDLAGVERALRRAAPELPFDRAYTSPTVRRILGAAGRAGPGPGGGAGVPGGRWHRGAVCGPNPCAPRRGVRPGGGDCGPVPPPLFCAAPGPAPAVGYGGGAALAQVLDSLWPAVPGTAAVLVGHGSGHPGSMAYPALQGVLELMGRSDLVVGTVEGRPDQAAVLKRLEALEVERVILLPLLLAAGVHAREDIAGPQPDSWISTLKAAGFQTWARLEGMGRLPQIQALYQAGLERLREGAADRAL